MANVNSNRSNEIVFKTYQDVINTKLRAGKDVSRLTKRLNQLLSRFKNKQLVYHQKKRDWVFSFTPISRIYRRKKNMKKEKRSDYANYLVLSDKSNNKLGNEGK